MEGKIEWEQPSKTILGQFALIYVEDTYHVLQACVTHLNINSNT